MKRNQVKAVVAEAFKVNSKHVQGLVLAAVNAAKHAHEGVRTKIVAWKGERPETLEAMKEEVKKQCKAWLKEEGRLINPQSVYNYQSDLMAACNGYIAYAGMTDKKRKAFDKAHAERTGYHSLIKFLRDTKRGKKSDKPETTTATRLKSAWKNHAKEQAKKAKDMLRYAPTDVLLNLIDFAEGLVKARKTGAVENLQARLRKAA